MWFAHWVVLSESIDENGDKCVKIYDYKPRKTNDGNLHLPVDHTNGFYPDKFEYLCLRPDNDVLEIDQFPDADDDEDGEYNKFSFDFITWFWAPITTEKLSEIGFEEWEE